MSKEPKPVFSLERAQAAAAVLVELVKPGCQRIEIAGSIRRNRETVHDIDLVASAIQEAQAVTGLFGVMETLRLGPVRLLNAIRTVAKIDNARPDARILRFAFSEIPVEIYLTEPDGCNFEALLQMRTGSQGHNAWLAARAQRLGLCYHAGYGIFRPADDGLGERVDDGSEAGIYAALGLDYILPENRG